MTETTKRSGARGRSDQRRRKSAAWKSSLLATGLGAVVLGSTLFAGLDTGAAAASPTDSRRETLLAQTQGQSQTDTLNPSGDAFWFNNGLQDDGGVLVSPSQGSRSSRNRTAVSGQFVRPMTRTRGS